MPAHIADILRLQLCLGARVGEVAGMTAAEMATDASGRLIWRLPAARSKNGRERATPTVGLALSILEPRLKAAGARAGDGPLFVSERSFQPTTSDVGVAIINRRARMPIADWASHDLRRTVATEMAKLELPLDTIATVLGRGRRDRSFDETLHPRRVY